MKPGHFVAIICGGLAVLSAGVLYWDLQDGEVYPVVLFIPIFTGTFALALALFPGGGSGTAEDAADPDQQDEPLWHPRTLLVAAGLAGYLYLWAQQYLQGQEFFTWSTQLALLVAVAGLGFILRRRLRRQ